MSKAAAPASRRAARKPSARKLKVFVTAIGFHDAYVAAPSRKAALAAWGSTHDLFARGVASEVIDPDLMPEPLAHPGEVVKRIRGTREEQIAALGEPPKPRTTKAADAAAIPAAKSRPAKPTAPDDRAVKAACSALRDAEVSSAQALEAIARERQALDAREQALRRRADSEQARLRRDVDEAEADFATRRRRYQRDLAAYEQAG